MILVCCPSETMDLWIQQVHSSLTNHSLVVGPGTLSNHMRDELLSQRYEDSFHDNLMNDRNETAWLVQGIPRRPLYKELGMRLCHWEQRRQKQENESVDQNEESRCRLIVPAENLGLVETDDRPILLRPPSSPMDITRWFQTIDDASICRILGVRSTIGTVEGILPLPQQLLLSACQQLHRPNSKLTTAARARSKHAHRGQDLFFGLARGSAESQNEATQRIIQHLLSTCVWINLHRFAGLPEGNLVLEIRQIEGYGARWLISNALQDVTDQCNVQFRGFLEPQVPDGHEMRWRH